MAIGLVLLNDTVYTTLSLFLPLNPHTSISEVSASYTLREDIVSRGIRKYKWERKKGRKNALDEKLMWGE